MANSTTRNRLKRNHLKKLFISQKGKCYWCSEIMNLIAMPDTSVRMPLIMATFDHIILKSMYGTYALDNGVAACLRCNRLRGNIEFDEYKELFPPTVGKTEFKIAEAKVKAKKKAKVKADRLLLHPNSPHLNQTQSAGYWRHQTLLKQHREELRVKKMRGKLRELRQILCKRWFPTRYAANKERRQRAALNRARMNSGL